jgi:hypothetical protein
MDSMLGGVATGKPAPQPRTTGEGKGMLGSSYLDQVAKTPAPTPTLPAPAPAKSSQEQIQVDTASTTTTTTPSTTSSPPMPAPAAPVPTTRPVSGTSYLDSISRGISTISGQGTASYLDKMSSSPPTGTSGVEPVSPAQASASFLTTSRMTREERDRALEAKVEKQVEFLAEKAAEQAAEKAAEFGT